MINIGHFVARFKLDPSHRWDYRIIYYTTIITYIFDDYHCVVFNNTEQRFFYFSGVDFITRQEFKQQLAIRKTDLYKAVYSEGK